MPERIEPHDVRALARLLGRVQDRLAAVERAELVALGLTPAAFRLLELVAREGPHAPGEAAERLGVRPPTVSGWIGGLLQAGLVERGVGADGRRAVVRVSESGEARFADASDAVRRAQAGVIGTLGPHDQAELVRLLARLQTP